MTTFGILLNNKTINKTKLAEKAGLTKQRISELSIRENARFRLDEAILISKALEMSLEDFVKEINITL